MEAEYVDRGQEGGAERNRLITEAAVYELGTSRGRRQGSIFAQVAVRRKRPSIPHGGRHALVSANSVIRLAHERLTRCHQRVNETQTAISYHMVVRCVCASEKSGGGQAPRRDLV